MDLKSQTVTVQWHESLFATSDPFGFMPRNDQVFDLQ